MDILQQFYPALRMLLPALAVLAAIGAVLRAAHWLLLRRKLDLGEESRFPRRIFMFFITALALVVVLLLLPVSVNTRNQLFALLGLLLTAVRKKMQDNLHGAGIEIVSPGNSKN